MDEKQTALAAVIGFVLILALALGYGARVNHVSPARQLRAALTTSDLSTPAEVREAYR
jgi:hypothetical protein